VNADLHLYNSVICLILLVEVKKDSSVIKENKENDSFVLQVTLAGSGGLVAHPAVTRESTFLV
jgi:hypothetical protein